MVKMRVYISNKEIEEIAEGLVQTVFGKIPQRRVDIDALARYLGLNVIYASIAEADEDKIGFVSDGKTYLTVLENGE